MLDPQTHLHTHQHNDVVRVRPRVVPRCRNHTTGGTVCPHSRSPDTQGTHAPTPRHTRHPAAPCHPCHARHTRHPCADSRSPMHPRATQDTSCTPRTTCTPRHTRGTHAPTLGAHRAFGHPTRRVWVAPLSRMHGRALTGVPCLRVRVPRAPQAHQTRPLSPH